MTGPEVLGAIGAATASCLAVGGLVFKLGQHSQRLAQAEKDIAELRAKAGDHDTRLGVVVRLEAQLVNIEGTVKEVAHDVKNLLTGRLVPARRRGADEA